MTAVIALLKAGWPYVLCALVAGYLTHRVIDVPRYDALQTSLASYKAQEAAKDEAAQKVATDALQAQIDTRLATEANNGKVISQLQSERDAAVTDRDFARRLLAAAQATAAPGRGGMSAAAGGSGTHDSTGAPGDRPAAELAQLIADSATECRIAIQRLTALQEELRPQL